MGGVQNQGPCVVRPFHCIYLPCGIWSRGPNLQRPHLDTGNGSRDQGPRANPHRAVLEHAAYCKNKSVRKPRAPRIDTLTWNPSLAHHILYHTRSKGPCLKSHAGRKKRVGPNQQPIL